MYNDELTPKFLNTPSSFSRIWEYLTNKSIQAIPDQKGRVQISNEFY